MIKKYLAHLALTTSLVALSVTSALPLVSEAQTNKTYPYSFCTEDTVPPPQELSESIAYVLDSNYEGGVKYITPICYGLNPRAQQSPIWVYKVEFNGGNFLDVAIMNSKNGERLISIKDDRKASAIADGSGWTKWIPLKSPRDQQ